VRGGDIRRKKKENEPRDFEMRPFGGKREERNGAYVGEESLTGRPKEGKPRLRR